MKYRIEALIVLSSAVLGSGCWAESTSDEPLDPADPPAEWRDTLIATYCSPSCDFFDDLALGTEAYDGTGRSNVAWASQGVPTCSDEKSTYFVSMADVQNGGVDYRFISYEGSFPTYEHAGTLALSELTPGKCNHLLQNHTVALVGPPRIEDVAITGTSEGPGRRIASCSDGNACTELHEGADANAFQKQCDLEGNTSSTNRCIGFDGGPACLGATVTSAGVRVKVNLRWKENFCAENPYIDTRGTCLDLGGSPDGPHCVDPNL